jgi:hypothetical protein
MIQYWTHSKYYHAEIIIDNTWISAEVDQGVILRKLRPAISDRWTIIDIPPIDITEDHYNKIYTFIYGVIGSKYDLKGIFLSQIIKIGADNPRRWFCSELASKILQLSLVKEYIDIEPSNMSPADMHALSSYRLPRELP